MQRFIRKPDLDMYAGVRVTKDTVLEYEREGVKQKIENLELVSVSTVKTDTFESKYETTIHLKEGDVLIFEEEGRGYIKPVEDFVTIAEAIEDYKNIEDLG